MNLKYFQSVALLATITTFVFTACQKADMPSVPMIAEDYQDMTQYGGMAININIDAADWSVEYVKDESAQQTVKDSTGTQMRIQTTDTISAAGGWLRMAKTTLGDSLYLDLKENFTDLPRILVIGLKANEKEEEIRITQHRGRSYKIVDKQITEIDSLRKTYTNNDQTERYTFRNATSVQQSVFDRAVFGGVRYNSTFHSEDYGAFDWMSEQDSVVLMNDLRINDTIYWSAPVKYARGTTLTPDSTGWASQTHVPPHSTIMLNGHVTYVERVSKYTFTVQNEQAGNRFDISGTWRQIVPISSTLIIESLERHNR